MTNDEIAGLEKARTIADTEALEQLAKRVGDTVSPYEAQLLLTILSRPDYFRLPDPRWTAFCKLKWGGKINECIDLVFAIIDREIDTMQRGGKPNDELAKRLVHSLATDAYTPKPAHKEAHHRITEKVRSLPTADRAPMYAVGSKYYILQSLKTTLLKDLENSVYQLEANIRHAEG